MTRLAIAVCCYAAIFAVSFCCALALRFDIDPLQFLYFAAGNPVPIPAGAAGRSLFELEQQQFAVDTFRGGLGAPGVWWGLAAGLFVACATLGPRLWLRVRRDSSSE